MTTNRNVLKSKYSPIGKYFCNLW